MKWSWAVDVAGDTFTLEGGVVFTVTAETTFDADGDLLSLQEMADAIDAGTAVRAKGRAVVDDVSGALVVLTVKVKT